ncbi:hypothetical protein Echvi_0639 [Echinicola vietnamensis DSM 17526]|uniref:Uncharacterized protein n=1 Tax=Echinicola vietnamensis (strain DSM 17526 / LMG 23754 / KMM 6221) TaxID=926556 RepID=L0FUD9_ECHVK|nr:hypothetical protein Echvi_0639 [Echinicola vietnamensis DSM 17526]
MAYDGSDKKMNTDLQSLMHTICVYPCSSVPLALLREVEERLSSCGFIRRLQNLSCRRHFAPICTWETAVAYGAEWRNRLKE